MKHFLLIVLLTMSSNIFAADLCKTVKSCSDWATNKTGVKYELGNLDRRNLKQEKDFNQEEGDADLIFNFLLQSNSLVRIKRESGYQIIQMKDLKDFQFTPVKAEEIPPTLDFYSTEFSLSNKEKVKNALIIIKKFLSKNGRALEVADVPRIQVIDTGLNLIMIKSIITELSK
ncbi:MAG: hypothetical protein WC635_05835 [Bacteriovorax sp.]|jgi:hypothetical protein